MNIIINNNKYLIMQDKSYEVLISYHSIIAKKNTKTGKIILDKFKWDYSTTTGKHIKNFLGMDKKQIEKLILSKEILLKNLN